MGRWNLLALKYLSKVKKKLFLRSMAVGNGANHPRPLKSLITETSAEALRAIKHKANSAFSRYIYLNRHLCHYF